MSRCLRGIPFSVGGRASCLDVSAVSLFPFVGEIVSRCSHGIHFSFGRRHRNPTRPLYPVFRWRGKHRDSISPRYHFSRLRGEFVSRCSRGIIFLVGGESCPDPSTVSRFLLGGGASYLDVSAVSLFPFEGGGRVPMSSRDPFFRWGHHVLMSPR